MNAPEPTEAQVIALFDGYWGHLDDEVLDGYRREFEARGWSAALEIVEDEMAVRWIVAHPATVVGIAAA